MNQKQVHWQMIEVGAVIFLVVVGLSGCVSDQNTGGDTSNLLGTWTWSLDMSMGGPMMSSSVTQITFTEDAVTMSLTSDQGTFTMNYTYVVNGNTLVLESKFEGRGGGDFRGQPRNGTGPWNGTRPPGNDSWSNGTQPPRNGSWSPNGSRPFGGERPSMSLSLTYRFDDGYRVLYLNDSQFVKNQ
ncbi:MAG: hypothetical protein V1726_03295 [Methanobacteriota archaeon]